MKKLCILAFLAFGLSFTSCSSDDDSNAGTPSVAGKWNYETEKVVVSGIVVYDDVYDDNQAGCAKDYIELLDSAVSNEVDYYTADCMSSTEVGTWTQNNNIVSINYGEDDVMTYTIESVSATALQLSMTETYEGATYTTVYTFSKG